MDTRDLARKIEATIDGAQATVTGDGSKFEAVVISEAFAGLSQVKKHQMVYRVFSAELASGAMHALSSKAYTPSEWETVQNR